MKQRSDQTEVFAVRSKVVPSGDMSHVTDRGTSKIGALPFKLHSAHQLVQDHRKRGASEYITNPEDSEEHDPEENLHTIYTRMGVK